MRDQRSGRAFEQDRNSIGYPHLNVKTASKIGKVVTAEEHNIIGGLGGAVAECLAEKCPTKMYRIGMRDKPVSASRAHTKMHLPPAGGQSSRSILLDCCVFSRCPYAIMNGL